MYSLSGIFDEYPITLFDSSPSSQSYLSTLATRGWDHLKIAWTGDPQRVLEPSDLRVQWTTIDNSLGYRDYPLREAQVAYKAFEMLQELQDVKRVVVLGYAASNPFAMHGAQSAFEVECEQRKRAMGEDGLYQKRHGPKTEKTQNVKIESIERYIDDQETKELERRNAAEKQSV